MAENEVQNNAPETKQNDKEYNFRALEAKYQRELQQAQQRASEAERVAQELSKRNVVEDDDDSEPYVDHKKLEKKLARFEEKTSQKTQSEIQRAVHTALAEERKQNWIKQNGDFFEVLQHADKFAAHDPELAETILEMPEGFERQKLVYKSIKSLGLHKPKVPESSIQSKVDANRKSPYYQPSGVGSPPYASSGDYSVSGQKQAYDKMQELKSRLRV